MNQFTDEQLIARYLKDSDESALESLVARYLPLVYGFVRRYTGSTGNASDITQEVFIKVWRNLKRFDEFKSFRAWIFTIAKHTAIDWLKKKTAVPFSKIKDDQSEHSFVDNIPDMAPSVVDFLSSKETARGLSLALARLPAQYNSVINMHINDGLKFREIAELLEKPINTVKTQYFRGILLLKKILTSK
ncbi:MAG: sigma-70 family RNA polymerase sigma factor [Parcubacteria group bacterium Licking1014_17]|nr:MAG: sigma-70 family RNA polymerase sigma factor [Parcubacteria group bacterium Licking1014_17]